jgi:hypothetical protein
MKHGKHSPFYPLALSKIPGYAQTRFMPALNSPQVGYIHTNHEHLHVPFSKQGTVNVPSVVGLGQDYHEGVAGTLRPSESFHPGPGSECRTDGRPYPPGPQESAENLF